MSDIRDQLLKLDRDDLAEKAKELGISITDTMSRAEIITLIEQRQALQEFGEIRTFSEQRFLIVGLFFMLLAVFILSIQTLYYLQTGTNVLAPILVPLYLVFRALGGFIISATLFSLGLKTGYRSITPVMRATFIIGAVLIIIVVLVFIPLPTQWG